MNMTVKPLEGVVVAELGTTVAGPFACRVLCELGARVVKFESSRGGDPVRSWPPPHLGGTPAPFQALNRGKESVQVDLRNDEDRKKVVRFITEQADVVVQNMRPGALDKLGLGANALCKAAPRLVYCNISAFGNKGPLKDLAGYDPLMQAFSGIISVTGEADRPPSRVGVSIVDIGTSAWAVVGIQAALMRRNLTGKGGVVDASLFETSLNMMILPVVQYEAGGDVPERTGLRGPLVAPNGGFETADGLLVVSVATNDQFVKFCDVMELSGLPDDPKFATVSTRMANEAALTGILTVAFKTRRRQEWADALNTAGVPNAPVQDLAEVMAHPQTIASGIMQSSPTADFRLPGLPFSLDGIRPAFNAIAPELGADTQFAFDFDAS
jgi:crotonobetainyl-CoA:carnitine CoA-transferase CaiB-like acyl-CoA transferase